MEVRESFLDNKSDLEEFMKDSSDFDQGQSTLWSVVSAEYRKEILTEILMRETDKGKYKFDFGQTSNLHFAYN